MRISLSYQRTAFAVLVIALDTTTAAGSVALVDGDRVIEERAGDASRTHAERLPAEIVALAEAHRVRLREVDLFAVAVGPGSFTGLRIGIATMQGLASIRHRRIFGISTLDALAHAAARDIRPGTPIAVWMDAHRREVFASLYRVTPAASVAADRLQRVDGPTVGDPSATLKRWAAELGVTPAVFVGDGAALYEQVIHDAAADARITGHPMLAGTIGRLAIARAAEAVDPGDVRPLYVRRPDAVIARDAR
jgi:tRNA threonylcarbamoyladenosine biosynthesis protein TsaB